MSEREPALGILERIGKAAEDAVLMLLRTGMIGLAATQIVLRNLFDFGFVWTDELLRLLVLWLAVAGALAASRQDRHISIAVLDRLLPERGQWFARALTRGFTAAVCGVIAWHSLAFVRSSLEYGDVLLGNVPAWILQSVLPLGFGLICYRYTLIMLKSLQHALRGRQP